MSDLMIIHAKTDGSNTTGTFDLESDAFSNTPNYIRIPKGFKLKIWSMSVDGAACDVDIKVSRDGGTNYTTVRRIHLESADNLDIEKKSRPISIISSKSDNDYVQFAWIQSTAAETHITMIIEITDN